MQQNTRPLTLIIPDHILRPILVTAECIRLNQAILEPLLVTGNSRKRKLVQALEIHQALKILTKTCKNSGARYGFAGIKILPIVLDFIRCLISSSNIKLLRLSLKLLRNLCDGEKLNQNCFLEEDGVDVVDNAFKSISFERESDITLVGLQLLGNFCGGGEEHQAAVWSRFFPVVFKDISRVRVRRISDVLCTVLYVCCNGSDALMGQLRGVQGLHIVAEILRTSSRENGDDSLLMELLIKLCLEDSCFSPLFSELSILAEQNTFTPMNGYLLKMLFTCLFLKGGEITLSKKFAISILGLLKRVVGVVNFSSRGESPLPTGSPAVDVLGCTINILMAICIRTEDAVVDLLLSSGLVNILLGFLRELGQPGIIKKVNPQDNTGGQLKVCPYQGFRQDIVAVIANCLYKRKHVQDEIRHDGSILLLLQQCADDEDNNLLSGMATVAVKNLLDRNIENQRVVRKLKNQGIAPVFAHVGLGVMMVNPVTGGTMLIKNP